jgi:hypothetical protein
VSPVKYELGFISQKTAFFIVTAVNNSNFTKSLNFNGKSLGKYRIEIPKPSRT